MKETYYKKLEEKINNIQIEQKNKFRRFVVFMVALCLIISSITGVASYTLAANQVGYTARDTSWSVDNTQDAIDELRDTVGYALVGSIFSYMGNNAPFGYLACDGTEYNIADYPRLAEHFTSEFGSSNYFGGDGSTTFAVPDLRGEFLRGTGTATRNTGTGLAVGKHQDATSHINGANFHNEPTGTYIGGQIYGTYAAANYPGNTDLRTETSGNTWITPSTISIQSNTSKGITNYTSRPTNTAVLYIIKY